MAETNHAYRRDSLDVQGNLPRCFRGVFAREQFHVRIDHDANQIFESHFGSQTRTFFGLARVPNQQVDSAGRS